MYNAPKSFIVLAIGLLLFSFNSAYAGLTVNPGSPQTICKGDSVTLGGSPTASGGTAPYNYTWSSSPAAGMNNSGDANPDALITQTTMFYVTVTDAAGGRVIDSVQITLNNVSSATAGNDTSICPLTAGATLGNTNNATYVYSWTPLSSGLSCYNCAHPTATPASTTTYTLLVNNSGCLDSSHVTVTVLATPTITVTTPVTVKEGSQVTLNASGASTYFWQPDSVSIFGANTADPQVSPNASTVYTVVGIGADGCPGFNHVDVIVIPDSELTFYNTFTPNGDGINDTWFVGNLDLFITTNTLTVYNRYGKEVYSAQPYLNNWDGTSLGSDLPDATYYYILDTGKGTKYKGSVTIIRKKN